MPHLRILHVDDDPRLMKAVARLIRGIVRAINENVSDERWELSYKMIDEPQHALEWLKSNTVDLVISDFSMPMMDGVSFYEHAKGMFRDPHPRWVFMSSSVDQPRLQATVARDQLLLLDKPFEQEQVVTLIETVVQHLSPAP